MANRREMRTILLGSVMFLLASVAGYVYGSRSPAKASRLTPASTASTAAASPLAEFIIKDHYTKTEHVVPMRDGVNLFTLVYSPKDASTTYPMLLRRTPYSVRPYAPHQFPRQLGPSPEFAPRWLHLRTAGRAWDVQIRGYVRAHDGHDARRE